jgi:hypothetical protein
MASLGLARSTPLVSSRVSAVLLMEGASTSTASEVTLLSTLSRMGVIVVLLSLTARKLFIQVRSVALSWEAVTSRRSLDKSFFVDHI